MGLRGFRVIFSPDLLKLIQMMWSQERPIPSQIIKVVHDDGYKEVEDLKWEQKSLLLIYFLILMMVEIIL